MTQWRLLTLWNDRPRRVPSSASVIRVSGLIRHSDFDVELLVEERDEPMISPLPHVAALWLVPGIGTAAM